MREKLLAAFAPFAERVPKHRIDALIDLLVIMGGPERETPFPAFRPASPQSAGQEFKAIAHHARKLAELLKGMSGTAIDTLAAMHLVDMAVLRTQLPSALNTLEAAAVATRCICLWPPPPGASGAPPKGRATAVGDMLARFYAETGTKPTVTKDGPFFTLVAAVIAAMQIKASPAGVTATACRRWREKTTP